MRSTIGCAKPIIAVKIGNLDKLRSFDPVAENKGEFDFLS